MSQSRESRVNQSIVTPPAVWHDSCVTHAVCLVTLCGVTARLGATEHSNEPHPPTWQSAVRGVKVCTGFLCNFGGWILTPACIVLKADFPDVPDEFVCWYTVLLFLVVMWGNYNALVVQVLIVDFLVLSVRRIWWCTVRN